MFHPTEYAVGFLGFVLGFFVFWFWFLTRLLTILIENYSINYNFFFRKVKYRDIELHKLLLVKLLCGNIRFKASMEENYCSDM